MPVHRPPRRVRACPYPYLRLRSSVGSLAVVVMRGLVVRLYPHVCVRLVVLWLRACRCFVSCSLPRVLNLSPRRMCRMLLNHHWTAI
jgi:hypothetical protein